jgi:hypothetical protein
MLKCVGLGIGGWDVCEAMGMWLVKLIRMAIVRAAYAFARYFDASIQWFPIVKWLAVCRCAAFSSLSPSGRGLGAGRVLAVALIVVLFFMLGRRHTATHKERKPLDPSFRWDDGEGRWRTRFACSRTLLLRRAHQ